MAVRTPPSTSALDRAVAELEERIEKELERAKSGHAPGTATIGGWAKVGNRVHELLEVSIVWICAAEGLEPEESLRGLDLEARVLSEASFLVLGRAFKKLVKLPAASRRPVRRIVQQCVERDSVFERVTRKRRDRVHERTPNEGRDVRLLRELDDLIGKIRADLSSGH